MLNFFLVLGLVPGTNIQLTFSEILLVFVLYIAGVWLYFNRSQRVVVKQEVVQLSRLHSFSYPIHVMTSEESTGHKAEVLLKDIVSQYLDRVAQLVRRVA